MHHSQAHSQCRPPLLSLEIAAKLGLEGTQSYRTLFMQGQTLIVFPLHQRNMRLSLVGAVPLPQNSVSRTHRRLLLVNNSQASAMMHRQLSKNARKVQHRLANPQTDKSFGTRASRVLGVVNLQQRPRGSPALSPCSQNVARWRTREEGVAPIRHIV